MTFSSVVAGRFYTSDPAALAKEVDGYIADASVEDFGEDVMGLIAPHAGYPYSGPVAGYSYKAILGKTYDVVVVIGLSHQMPGTVSVLDYPAYQTPLGDVPIDVESSRRLIGAASWIDDNEALFVHEHSLEVQLPFLQRAVPDLTVVMISMRTQTQKRCAELAKILDDTFAGKNVLFVASSDMSHFHEYHQALKMDLAALDQIEDFDIDGLAGGFASGEFEMCGSGPVLTLLSLYELRGGTAAGVKVLKYQNSGDTAGARAEVVGYGAVALVSSAMPALKTDSSDEKSEDYLSADDKKTLLQIARSTVQSYVTTGVAPVFDITSENLKNPGAAFVTLHKLGALRGCIGHVEAKIPLWKCVQDMAIAAATQDPRFGKVTESEIPDLHIEISVLTPQKRCDDPSQIEVGRHGLMIERGYNRGLLLPQVPTEWGWDREKFLEQTCHKAGMDGDCWKDKKTKIETFEAIVFSE